MPQPWNQGDVSGRCHKARVVDHSKHATRATWTRLLRRAGKTPTNPDQPFAVLLHALLATFALFSYVPASLSLSAICSDLLRTSHQWRGLWQEEVVKVAHGVATHPVHGIRSPSPCFSEMFAS